MHKTHYLFWCVGCSDINIINFIPRELLIFIFLFSTETPTKPIVFSSQTTDFQESGRLGNYHIIHSSMNRIKFDSKSFSIESMKMRLIRELLCKSMVQMVPSAKHLFPINFIFWTIQLVIFKLKKQNEVNLGPTTIDWWIK